MGFRKKTKGRKSRSVFRTVLYPLLFVVLVEGLLLQASLSDIGVLGKLNQNERDILKKQIQTRGTFLENTMKDSWSDLSLLKSRINTTTQQLLDDRAISLDKLDEGSQECELLLTNISDELISTLYTKRTSGIFVIINTHNLDEDESSNKPGIYIRDYDPLSPPSKDYADLLFGRAPVSLVESLDISTDRRWEPLFKFTSDISNYDYFYKPYQSAYYNKANSFEAVEYGYWSTSPRLFQERGNKSIAYSVPLILEDGTVYGVLGIELSFDYLKAVMPNDELHIKGGGSYLLAVQNPEFLTWSPLLIRGPLQTEVENEFTLEPLEGGGYTVDINDKTYIANFMDVPLYRSDTPYLTRRWALLGMVEMNQLYAFSSQVKMGLRVSFILTILAGVAGSIIVSRRLSNPIFTLSKEVSDAQKSKDGIPELSVTNIQEIDRFAEAFTALSKDVVNSSARFLSILDMASVRMGGFEIQKKEATVFATKTFFELFGWGTVDISDITLTQFKGMLESMDDCIVRMDARDGSCLYRLEVLNSSVRYIRVKVTENEERVVGVAEDVTASTIERLRIEHERDYDLLTGLYNRRAFYCQVNELFKTPDRLKNAVIIMVDLDNLKIFNDTYGHDCGDKYIRRAGQCFVESLPETVIASRVSGDEFYFFLYGFKEKESIRQILKQLHTKIKDTWFQLPDGEFQKISVSGGIAWYPDDSRDFQELMKLADFAMYQVKRAHKGAFYEFDQEEYNKQEYLRKMHKEFKSLMENESLFYHFQPIVDAKTGQAFAFEALMRINLKYISSPEVAIKIAREEQRLLDIERITWFKSMEAFQSLINREKIPDNCLLFIKTIASQCLSVADSHELCNRFPELYSKVVLEVVESEDMNADSLRAKRTMSCFSGVFALDDYGTGYNSEKNLLEFAPTYIKVDKSIIREINTDKNKQKIVSNIVAYAHERNMYIIAECIETKMELQMLLELGVDLLQGFYIAKPQEVPRGIEQEALETILSFWEKKKR